jgi:hypothetical protein
MRVIQHLYVGEPAPLEYLSLVLCRDVYHCTPNALADVPVQTALKHIICLNGENEVRAKLSE